MFTILLNNLKLAQFSQFLCEFFNNSYGPHMSIQTTLNIPTLHPLCLNLTNSMWYEMLQSTFPGRRPKTVWAGASLQANLIFSVEALMDFNRIQRGLSSVERQYEDRKILRNIAFIENSTQIKHKTNKKCKIRKVEHHKS